MKWFPGFAAATVFGVGCVFAQLDGTAAAEGKAPIEVSDTEAAGIAHTIKGYVQGPVHRGHLELFDRKKGENVVLRLDRIVADDPASVVFPKEGLIAVAAQCSQVKLTVKEGVDTTEEETGDKYEIWFVLERGGIVSSKVLDTYIKSVNGKPMYKWTQAEDGTWSATLVPDGE